MNTRLGLYDVRMADIGSGNVKETYSKIILPCDPKFWKYNKQLCERYRTGISYNIVPTKGVDVHRVDNATVYFDNGNICFYNFIRYA